MVPTTSEIKRIILAFESKIPQEIRFCLNSLLLYSVSKQSPFYLYNYRIVYNELVEYFVFVYEKIKRTEVFNGGQFYHPSQSGEGKESANAWEIGDGEYVLQMKILLTIFRNLFMIKANEGEIQKNEKFKKKLFQLLLHNNDPEINRLVFDVFIILSKFLQLSETEPTHV